jgi:hypothetical protein
MTNPPNLQTRAPWRITSSSVARPLTPIVLGLCLYFVPAHATPGAPLIRVPMTADRWQTTDNAEYQKHKDVDALYLKRGVAVLNDLTFGNGTIEFDVDPGGKEATGRTLLARERVLPAGAEGRRQ